MPSLPMYYHTAAKLLPLDYKLINNIPPNLLWCLFLDIIDPYLIKKLSILHTYSHNGRNVQSLYACITADLVTLMKKKTGAVLHQA